MAENYINVHFWLQADIPDDALDIRYRGLSGHPERSG